MTEFDIEISLSKSEAGIITVLRQLFPSWQAKDIIIQEMTGGLMNKLVKCHNQQDPNKNVLIKIYGKNSELIVNHRNCELVQKYLSQIGLTVPILASFRNGMVYSYQPGRCITNEECVSPPIRTKIAAMLAKFHRAHPPGMKCEPGLWRLINGFINQIPDRFSDAQIQNRYVSLFPPKNVLILETRWLYEICESLSSPLVFSHNDLWIKNIIFDESSDQVAFIDFEISEYNYQAFDIALLFSFNVGEDVNRPIYARGSDDEIREFLREYLFFLEDGDCSAERVELLLNHTKHFILVATLYQATWALQQIQNSVLEFDYLEIARVQMDNYFIIKKELYPQY